MLPGVRAFAAQAEDRIFNTPDLLVDTQLYTRFLVCHTSLLFSQMHTLLLQQYRSQARDVSTDRFFT